MSKIKILLVDPAYYNKYSQAYLTVPLGIGYVSSYISSQHPNDTDIEIHKNPQDVFESMAKSKPDIIGLSLFYWNTAEVTEYARKCWQENDNNVGEPARINVLFGARLIYMEKWVYDVMLEISKLLIDDNILLQNTIEILHICKNERIDIRDSMPRENTLCNYDLNQWKKTKFKEKIDNFYIGEHQITFDIDSDSTEKISAFKKKFSNLKDLDYYYSAMDSISPRHKTLHTLSIKTEGTRCLKN